MPFCHSIAIRCSACRAVGWEGEGERHYTTTISGSRWEPQRGRLSSASIGGPLALTVCVCRRITGRPELSTSATYVTTQARRRAAAVQDPDSARIHGLCVASNPAVYALPRAPFRLSLLIRSE